MSISSTQLRVGQLVHFDAGRMQASDGEGAVVAVRPYGCDVILCDGRKFQGVNVLPADRLGIGFKLRDGIIPDDVILELQVKAAEYEAAFRLQVIMQREKLLAREAGRVITQAPLFYYNGIRDHKGAKLQRAHYVKTSDGAITVYSRGGDFSQLVRKCFSVQNDTDISTDYFQNDRIQVETVHPLYAQVKAAADDVDTKRAARHAKREQRRSH